MTEKHIEVLRVEQSVVSKELAKFRPCDNETRSMYCREWAQYVYKKHFVWNAKTQEDVDRDHAAYVNAGKYQIKVILDESDLSEEEKDLYEKEHSTVLIKQFEELLNTISDLKTQKEKSLVQLISQACRQWMTLPTGRSGLPDLFEPVEFNSYPDNIPLVDDDQDPSQLLDPLIIERQALCLPSDCFHLLKSMTGDIIISHTTPTCNHKKPTSKTPADLEVDRTILTEHEQAAVKKALEELAIALDNIWKPLNTFLEQLEAQDKIRSKLLGADCQETIDAFFASQKYVPFVDEWTNNQLPNWKKIKKPSEEDVERLDRFVQDHFRHLGSLVDQFLSEFVTTRFRDIREWNINLWKMIHPTIKAMDERISSLELLRGKQSSTDKSLRALNVDSLKKMESTKEVDSSEKRIMAELEKRVSEYKKDIEELIKSYCESSRPTLASRMDRLNNKDFKKKIKKVESGYYVIRQFFRYEITENVFPESLFGRFMLICLKPLMQEGEVMEAMTIEKEVQRFIESHKDLLQERCILLSRFEEGVQTGRRELAGVIGKLLLKEGMRIQGETVALQRQNNLLKVFGVDPEEPSPADVKKSPISVNAAATAAKKAVEPKKKAGSTTATEESKKKKSDEESKMKVEPKKQASSAEGMVKTAAAVAASEPKKKELVKEEAKKQVAPKVANTTSQQPPVSQQAASKVPTVPESIKRAASIKPTKPADQVNPSTGTPKKAQISFDPSKDVAQARVIDDKASANPPRSDKKSVEPSVGNEWPTLESESKGQDTTCQPAKEKKENDVQGWAEIVASVTSDVKKETWNSAPAKADEIKDGGWGNASAKSSEMKDEGWGNTSAKSTSESAAEATAEPAVESVVEPVTAPKIKQEAITATDGWSTVVTEISSGWGDEPKVETKPVEDVKKSEPEWRRKDKSSNQSWRELNNNTETKAKKNEDNLGGWGRKKEWEPTGNNQRDTKEGWRSSSTSSDKEVKDGWSSLKGTSESLGGWGNPSGGFTDNWGQKSSSREATFQDNKSTPKPNWDNAQVPWETSSSAPLDSVERPSTFSNNDTSFSVTPTPSASQASISKPPGLNVTTTTNEASNLISAGNVSQSIVPPSSGLPDMKEMNKPILPFTPPGQTMFMSPLSTAAVQLQEPLPANIDDFGKDMLLLMVKNLHRENSTLISTVYSLQQDMAMMNQRYAEILALAREREAQTVQLLETRKQTELEKAKRYCISLESRIKELEEKVRGGYHDRTTAGFENQDLFAGYRDEMNSGGSNNSSNNHGFHQHRGHRKMWSKATVIRCGNCGETGHSSAECKSYCRYCGSLEHLSEACPMN
ncbi:hypothetical protein CU097_004907 [Rhizopus azygosporus]|uniref:CCHC-type domain-containing protein n=1 Tax=Rhizopus azygosporus TaxID=86630 RepID=A0A367JMF1_RHIAZ|nr:hypothetical protein CU097_004907 [Rhizopus azygosporus]